MCLAEKASLVTFKGQSLNATLNSSLLGAWPENQTTYLTQGHIVADNEI